MSKRTLVDWRLAERTATAIAGGPPANGADAGYRRSGLEPACAEAIEAASAYTGLPLPPRPVSPELIDRREWSRISLATLADGSAAIEERVAGEFALPGPLEPLARRLVAAGTGAEAGLAVGYVARRVLGQYDFGIFGAERPGRLLFVGPNLDAVRVKLGADSELFLRWLALHETTHVLQLEGVPWLVPQLRALAARLVEAAAREIEPARIAELASRFARNPGDVGRSILRGEAVRLLADSAELAVLDRLQATMAVVEGHAEHVMDACAGALDPRLRTMRERLERQRASRGGLGEVIARLLGLELKLRQYELGRRFWDGVVAEAGEAAQELVWRSAADLPDLGELERPREWLERVAAPAAAR